MSQAGGRFCQKFTSLGHTEGMINAKVVVNQREPAGAYAGASAGPPGPGAGAVAGVARVELRVGS